MVSKATKRLERTEQTNKELQEIQARFYTKTHVERLLSDLNSLTSRQFIIGVKTIVNSKNELENIRVLAMLDNDDVKPINGTHITLFPLNDSKSSAYYLAGMIEGYRIKAMEDLE